MTPNARALSLSGVRNVRSDRILLPHVGKLHIGRIKVCSTVSPDISVSKIPRLALFFSFVKNNFE